MMLKRLRRPEPGPQERGLEDGVPSFRSLFSPPALEEGRDHLYLGPERFSRAYVLELYPRDIFVGWLDDALSLGDVDLSVYVEPVPDRKVSLDLAKKEASVEAQYRVHVKAGNVMRLPEFENILRDLKALRHAVEGKRERILSVTALFLVHAPSPDELKRKCRRFESALLRSMARARPLVFRQLSGLRSVLPLGNLEIDDYGRNHTTGGVAAMVPVSNPDVSHPSGVYLGRSLTTKAPVFYDSFAGPPVLPNPHVAVFGTTGSGKSVTLKLLSARSALLGTKTAVLDPESEYSKLVAELLGGSVIRVLPGEPSGLNPLDIEPEERDGRAVVNIADKAAELRAVLNAVSREYAGRPLDVREVGAVEEAVREEYAKRGITSDPESLFEPGGRALPGGGYAVGAPRKRRCPPYPTSSSASGRSPRAPKSPSS